MSDSKQNVYKKKILYYSVLRQIK